MIYAAVALAVVTAAAAAQAPRPLASGNYSGWDKIGQEPKLTVPSDTRRAIEVTPSSRPGLKPGPCGMPIIAADASFDPGIVIPIPGRQQADAKSEPVEPRPCGPFTTVPAKRK